MWLIMVNQVTNVTMCEQCLSNSSSRTPRVKYFCQIKLKTDTMDVEFSFRNVELLNEKQRYTVDGLKGSWVSINLKKQLMTIQGSCTFCEIEFHDFSMENQWNSMTFSQQRKANWWKFLYILLNYHPIFIFHDFWDFSSFPWLLQAWKYFFFQIPLLFPVFHDRKNSVTCTWRDYHTFCMVHAWPKIITKNNEKTKL